MTVKKKVADKVAHQIKYYQGFTDALASCSRIMEDMAQTTVQFHNEKEYDKIMHTIVNTLQGVESIWNETNSRLNAFIDNLADKNDLTYDPETEYLVFDEDTLELCVEQIKDKKESVE